MNKPKKIAVVIVAGLFVYLSMYTWNLRTGHLDALSSYTGLDISSFVLRPGLWVKDKVVGFWERYIYLVDLKHQNDILTDDIKTLRRQNMFLNAEANSAHRLERLLGFTSPEDWNFSGARVIAHRMGPASVLSTMTIDKGSTSNVSADMPVVGLDGVVGRILNVGAAASTVLLLTDANSHIAVIGENNRSPGMLSGQGNNQSLQLRYVNLNAIIDTGELLLTSGQSGIFPKGLPVARVSKVQRSDISLFLTIQAEPLVDISGLEEVLLLSRSSAQQEDGETAEAPASEEAVNRAAEQ